MFLKRKDSPGQLRIKRTLRIAFWAIILVVIALMSVIALISIKTFQHQSRDSSSELLGFYSRELELNASDLENIVQNIHSSNPSFEFLSSGNLSSSDEILHSYLLRNHINGSVRSGSMILCFDENRDIAIWQVGSGFDKKDFNKNYALERSIETFIEELPVQQLWHWNLYYNGDDALLVLPCKKNELYVAAALDLTKFIAKDRDFTTMQDYEIVFFDDKEVLTNNQVLELYNISFDDLLNDKHGFFTDLRYILQSQQIPNMPVNIASIMSVSKYLARYIPYLFLMIMVVFLMVILAISLYEMISLTRQSEAKNAEKEHAQLQYFQLQTRSHFFLNCLKSLYNMLEMGEYDKMKRMIMNFSDHIRFIFHDNLSLITLKEELDEVNDYAGIIQIDSSTPIMLIQKVPSDYFDCMVPPLIIQTFLENAVKYNAQYNKMLRFVIEAEITEDKEKKYLRIKMSDNGTGYDQEMLDKLNFDSDREYEQYHVGISNLKRRMDILFHGDCNLAFFNNTEQGGAMIMAYLPVIYSKDEDAKK